MPEIDDSGWTEETLAEVSPFKILWEQTLAVKKKTAQGREYEKKKIVVSSRAYANLFAVEVSKKAYNKLHLLQLGGATAYNATVGIKPSEGFAPIIYSGEKQ